MDLYIFHDRQIVGSLMDCTLFPDPRPEAGHAGFVRGTWPGFAETPFAAADDQTTLEFVLGDNETGDLYRHCQLYPSQCRGELVAFWYLYKHARS